MTGQTTEQVMVPGAIYGSLVPISAAWDPQYQAGQYPYTQTEIDRIGAGRSITGWSREQYTSACATAGVDPMTDEAIRADAYGLKYAEYTMPEWREQMTRAQRVGYLLAARRLAGIETESKVHPGTQAAALQSAGLDPVAMGGKIVDGHVFKPDADPQRRGPCGRCRKPGVWISGAGEYLCARHQDDY